MAMPRAETGSGARRRRSSASITVRAASTSRRSGRTAAVNPGAVSVAVRITLCSARATLARVRRPVIVRARSSSASQVWGPMPAASSRSSRAP